MKGGSSWQTHSAPRDSAKSLPQSAENSSINAAPGSLNDDSLVRGIVTDAIKRSKKSREQIAEEMQRTLAVTVTARMITAFTSESKELHRWPAAWSRAFCAAVDDYRLISCPAELAGLRVNPSAAEFDLLELGREYLRQKRASEKVQQLEERLRGVEL